MNTNLNALSDRLMSLINTEANDSGHLKGKDIVFTMVNSKVPNVATLVVEMEKDGKVLANISIFVVENHIPVKKTGKTRITLSVTMVDNSDHSIIWCRTSDNALEVLEKYFLSRLISRGINKGVKTGNLNDMAAKVIAKHDGKDVEGK